MNEPFPDDALVFEDDLLLINFTKVIMGSDEGDEAGEQEASNKLMSI